MPFVSLEGIDGSGKTEQAARLAARLRAAGQIVLATKEPDGGHLGAEIRSILARDGRVLSPVEQLLLVSAARYDHVRTVIAPALARGEWVVSDRFRDSTYAFQVAISDVDLEPLFAEVNEVVIGSSMPDLTIILDLQVEAASARRTLRGPESDDPSEAIRDFQSIRAGLLKLAAREPERCRIVDGDRRPDQVEEAIWREVVGLV
ncbi:dTMP kinase [Novosphingobium capsulatum]|uniref:dTMP kinase n=1 Tax=Novosphingobium capsulatum TaxID=13688 RepID=UPI00286A5F37|nr:dTMP kinase [Novosphingobium capsulatum]